MSYQCIIIDDEPLARELLEGYLQKLPDFELLASCSSVLDATTILSDKKVDLLFLDIEMPVLKGTDFFKNLAQRQQVIFTTAYRDYAVDGFELNALDYLLKPIFFERFFSAIQKPIYITIRDWIPGGILICGCDGPGACEVEECGSGV